MRLIGDAGEGIFLLDTGDGWGRVLDVADGGARLFDEHRLDPELVRSARPRPERRYAVELLATLVLRHGVRDPQCPNTRALEPGQLEALAGGGTADAFAA